jgi:hypothetical protein
MFDMLDETPQPDAPQPRCTWCSAVLPSDHETTCPSCGAALVDHVDGALPGLNSIDADAILRSARGAARSRPRGGRLLSWISGEYSDDEDASTATPGSLSPPPADVRREMLRLELEAQVANAQAEVEAMAADAAVEDGRSIPREAVEADAAGGAAAPPAVADVPPPGEPAAPSADADTPA